MPYAKPLPDEGPVPRRAEISSACRPRSIEVYACAWLGRFRDVTDSLQRPENRERLERRAFSRLHPDQQATFDELMAAADWTRASPGPFVDAEGAAQILGVTAQYVARLAVEGRLPWLPTGRLGGGPTRVYRREQIQVIANSRRVAESTNACQGREASLHDT